MLQLLKLYLITTSFSCGAAAFVRSIGAFSNVEQYVLWPSCMSLPTSLHLTLENRCLESGGISERARAKYVPTTPRGVIFQERFLRASSAVTFIATSMAGVVGPATQAFALEESPPLEVVSDLPSPLIPVVVAFVLLGGVGLLTGSLGDVIADEASLGERSGAKAKKEMERSRSSYFKK